MRKLRLYLDTSVISHLFAEDTPDKMEDTIRFWNDCVNDKYSIFISNVVTDEIEKCSEPKRGGMLDRLKQIPIQILTKSDNVIELAGEYIKNGVLSNKSFDDCLHIAFAVFYDCDIIVSWNFKHIVNYKTIDKVRIVNAINKFREISIVSPTMMLEEDAK